MYISCNYTFNIFQQKDLNRNNQEFFKFSVNIADDVFILRPYLYYEFGYLGAAIFFI